MTSLFLDILCPTYNRPDQLLTVIQDFLSNSHQADNIRLFVLNDGSEDLPDGSSISYRTINEQFKDNKKVYFFSSEKNVGLAKLIHQYYASGLGSAFSFLMNDKDRLIDLNGFQAILSLFETNADINFTMTSLAQFDQTSTNTTIKLPNKLFTAEEFLDFYIAFEEPKHCGMYSVIRNDVFRRFDILDNLNLRSHGLNDAFGFDIQIVLNVAANSKFVATTSNCFVHRSILGGATERNPLSFAICYYQYAKNTCAKLLQRKKMSRTQSQKYLYMWHLLILRGLVTVRSGGNYFEDGKYEVDTSLARRVTKFPILLYLALEIAKNRFFIAPMNKSEWLSHVINICLLNRQSIPHKSLEKQTATTLKIDNVLSPISRAFESQKSEHLNACFSHKKDVPSYAWNTVKSWGNGIKVDKTKTGTKIQLSEKQNQVFLQHKLNTKFDRKLRCAELVLIIDSDDLFDGFQVLASINFQKRFGIFKNITIPLMLIKRREIVEENKVFNRKTFVNFLGTTTKNVNEATLHVTLIARDPRKRCLTVNNVSLHCVINQENEIGQ